MQMFYENNLKIFYAKMFGIIETYCFIFVPMMTVAQFAKKRGVPLQTVYSWIYRNKTSENGFHMIQIGSIKMIQEIAKPKRVKA